MGMLSETGLVTSFGLECFVYMVMLGDCVMALERC